jgi:glycosyltransferase involved in cell wall biosynthesis
MKKVLIINTTINKGGAARVAYDVFENLKLDFDMYFAYGRGPKNFGNKTFNFSNKLEVFIHVFLVRFLGLEGFGSYFSTKKLIKFIEKEKFDLINLHNLHGYYVNFSTLINFLIESKIPVAYSLHDEWPITWLPAHSLGCEHCKNGLGKCHNTYAYPKSYFPIFYKYMLNKKRKVFSDKLNMTIVCPSVWLKNNIENSFLNKFKIEVIPNGIDTNIFKPSINKNELRIKHGLPLNRKIVLFSASNLKDKSKGVDYILEAAKILENRDYLFLGLGSGKIKDNKNIRTTGYIYNKNELAEFYALSDIFCFASLAETFLLSAAEALSCGIPVVGFDLPVVRELINNKVGILTKQKSDDLAEKINNLINSNKLTEIGILGRGLIENNYSKNIFYKNYTGLYNNVIKK